MTTQIKEAQGLSELLKLKGIACKLSELLADAEQNNRSYADVVVRLFKTEVTDRNERRLERNLAGAHFPVSKTIAGFDFGKVQGITKKKFDNLADCGWIDRRENLLFLGPPGIGKTHLAIALGLVAVKAGYKVCFERMTNLVKILVRADLQRSAQFRFNRIQKADLLVIDEIGYTPIERKEANLFFSLVSDRYERGSLIITSNKRFEEWAEMMGDDVITAAMLDRLLHHASIFSLEGESYRITNRKESKPTP
jgi:DNA replication protein DnaC